MGAVYFIAQTKNERECVQNVKKGQSLIVERRLHHQMAYICVCVCKVCRLMREMLGEYDNLGQY